MSLTETLRKAGGQLPRGTRTALRRLLTDSNIERLAARLAALQLDGSAGVRREPFFDGETTPPVDESFEPFSSAMALAVSPDSDPKATAAAFAEALQKSPPFRLLNLLGQRTTAASITDHRAFPPCRQHLIDSAAEAVTATGGLSVAARALSKHASRADDFWPQVNGNDEVRNATAAELIRTLLDDVSWWNVFHHHSQSLIFEVRIPSGHGARWSVDGDRFIGFVDPFRSDQKFEASQSSRSESEESAESESDAESASSAAGNSGPAATSPEERQTMTREELSAAMAEGNCIFRHTDFSGADLSGLNLSGLDFSGSDFRRAKLFRTDLRGCNLTECRLSGVYLAGTRLQDAVLRRADLRRCRADNVVWRNNDLEAARLDEINLRGALIESCRMRRIGLGSADLTDAVLEYCRLYGAWLEQVQLTGAFVNQCRFNNARMAGADCTDARFDGCKMDGADLSQAHFNNVPFRKCTFVETLMSGTDLSKASLREAELNRARMPGVRLVGADLRTATLVRADLSRGNLRAADMTSAVVDQADLSRCDLRSAVLAGACLQGADLTGADVVDTVVSEQTQFEAAKTIGVDFGTNWSMRQQVLESQHNLTIRHFRRKHPVLGALWSALLGCGRKPQRLLYWGVLFVLLFAVLMWLCPGSFRTEVPNPDFADHLLSSLAMFVTLDLAVDRGLDGFGRAVMLAEMLVSYLMLGFMAGLFSGIFPAPPE